MSSDQRFCVNTPTVVSEEIDGEVVILHLGSGNYYNTEKMGSLLWGWVESGRSVGEMIERLAEQSREDDPAFIASSVNAFFAELEEHELIVPSDASASADNEADESAAATDGPAAMPFEAPVLNCYSDMKDLLLLDPIHQVDERTGWPTPKDSALPED